MPNSPLEDHILGIIPLYADDITPELKSHIELFPEGDYVHHQAGKLKITEAELAAFAADVNARGSRIPLDYDHSFGKGQGSLSAGWFVPGTAVLAASSENPDRKSLYADVQWTPRGAQSIKDGEYKFISPEWNTKWKDKTTGAIKHGARLFAAALTNRPFFETMAPVTLCDEGIEEMLANDDPNGREAKKEETMTKAIAEALGLKADASESDITAELAARETAATEAASKLAELQSKPDPAVDATLLANAQAGAAAAIELFEMKRDTLLEAAIRDRKIDPAQREHYASLYAENAAGVTKLLDTVKPGSFEPHGSEGGEGGDPQPVLAQSASHDSLYGSAPPSQVIVNGDLMDVDPESTKIHTAALEVLEASGKGMNYTADEYAQAAVHAAAKQGVRL